jgi:hypothetical protein
MSQFETFLSAILSGSTALAQQTLQGFLTQAKGDTVAFLNQSKQNLNDWTVQLAQGQMTKDEFADLAGGLKDLAELHALTEAGVVVASVQQFRDALIKLVIDTAFKTFLP